MDDGRRKKVDGRWMNQQIVFKIFGDVTKISYFCIQILRV
jgi:hypothetical protein